jgi:transposase
MRRVREILRHRFEEGLGHKSIAVRVGAAPSTVRETLRRLERAGLSWPLAEDVSDAVLEAALYKAAGTKTGHRRIAEPDWAQVHRELKRKHVTLQILWDEYIGLHTEGYRYSRYCDLYRHWALKLPVTMRQDHAAGEKLFVDYAGDTVTVVIDRLSGKTRQAHLFVGVLGASSLSFAHARWSETLPDWIECHLLALETFGGAPALLVPDNAKVAVIKACHFDPQVNRTYTGMATHYGSAVLPTRPRRPRDKAKVEAAVRIVERWLLGRMRHRVFYSLADVNKAIGELLQDLNDKRVLRRIGRTRRQLFEELDYPACDRFRSSDMSLLNGRYAGLASIIMSISTSTFTPCPTGLPVSRSRHGSLPTRSRYSTRANGSQPTGDQAAMASTRRYRSTCHLPIGGSPTGRSSVSAARHRQSDLTSLCSVTAFSPTARIPNRATELASASFGSSKLSSGKGSMQPVAEHWKSALEPMDRCAPFSTITWTDHRPHRLHRLNPSTTPTSAVPAITTKEKLHACTSYP